MQSMVKYMLQKVHHLFTGDVLFVILKILSIIILIILVTTLVRYGLS